MQRTSAADRFNVEYHNIHLYESPRQRVESHTHHEAAELIVVLSGGYQASWRHAEHQGQARAGKGDVVYWPGNARRVESNGPSLPLRSLCVYFHWRNPVPQLPVRLKDRQGTILTLAGSMLAAKDSSLPQRRAMLNGYLAAMLAEVVRLSEQGRDELVERVAVYIEGHLRKPIYLEELARCAGLEKSYFCRRYRALAGRSPMDEVRRIRAEHAAGVLRSNPQLPLKDVALRVGIADEHQLSKVLKKCLGQTAREIRVKR